MRVLVTGAAGFVGSHLCEHLVNDGHEVLGVDDFSTGHPRNVAHLVDGGRFTLVDFDVRRPFRHGFGAERVYHLACPASPPHYQRDPVGTASTCFLGTLHALEHAHAVGARLFFASSSEVYGEPHEHPQREEHRGRVSTTGIRACYDEGKRIGETLCYDFHRQHGVEVRVARLFNTYGPRMALDDGRAVSNFVVQALSGEPLTVYGRGSQTRSFCYVDDTVRGIVALMEHHETIGPVNIGNPHEITVSGLAGIVCAAARSGSEVVYRPLPKDDPTRRQPDVSLARALLGWTPTTDVDAGIDRTVADFRARLAARL